MIWLDLLTVQRMQHIKHKTSENNNTVIFHNKTHKNNYLKLNILYIAHTNSLMHSSIT